jgi:uncharacterized protein YndB with AHSA1/START domain
MTRDILHGIEIKAEPKTVYDTVATKAGLAAFWTADVEGDQAVGAELSFGFPEAPMRAPITVAHLQAPSEVQWECRPGFPYWDGTRVSWSMAPGEGGTKVVFRHAGFSEDQTEFDFGSVSLTWALIVDRLKAVVEGGGRPSPFFP